MFQYTTETIINSAEGNLVNGSRFGVYSSAAGDTPLKTTDTAKGEDFLLIDGVNSFVLKYITAIYKNEYRADSKALATINLEKAPFAVDEVVCLDIRIKEQGSVRSSIQNAYLHKTKPFHYEITVKTAEISDVIDQFVALIKKDMAMTDFPYFKASKNDKTLVLTADDCYIQFDSVKIAEVLDIEDASTPLSAKLLGNNCTKEIAGVTYDTTPGDEGAGTVTRLVKNLRIPTNASINPFAADQGGKPVPGGQYDQYTIEYTTPRRHVSGTVVGSVNESLTTHVLFINKANASLDTAWKDIITILESAGIKVTPAGSKNYNDTAPVKKPGSVQ